MLSLNPYTGEALNLGPCMPPLSIFTAVCQTMFFKYIYIRETNVCLNILKAYQYGKPFWKCMVRLYNSITAHVCYNIRVLHDIV